MPYQRNLTVILGSRSPYCRLLSIVLCSGHTHILFVYLKGAGMHAHKNVDPISAYSLIQYLTSACSLNTQGRFPLLYSRKRCALSVPYLLTAFHDPIGVAARVVHLTKAFFTSSSDSSTRLYQSLNIYVFCQRYDRGICLTISRILGRLA